MTPSWPEKRLRSSKRWLEGEIKKVNVRLRMDLPQEYSQLLKFKKALETFLNNVDLQLKRLGKT